jgi:hypothetical protein
LLSNRTFVPPLAVMKKPLLGTLPLIQLWTAEVTSTVINVSPAETATPLATSAPCAGKPTVPLTVVSTQLPLAKLILIEPAVLTVLA